MVPHIVCRRKPFWGLISPISKASGRNCGRLRPGGAVSAVFAGPTHDSAPACGDRSAKGACFRLPGAPPTRLFALPAHSASSAHASMWTGFAGSRNLLVSATFCAPRSWGCRRTCANLYCRSGYFGTQTWRRVTDEDGWWRRHRAPTRDTTMNAWSLNPAWGRVSVPRGRSLT